MIRKRILQGGNALTITNSLLNRTFAPLANISNAFSRADEVDILARLNSLHLLIPNYRGKQGSDLLFGEYSGGEQVIFLGKWGDGIETEENLAEINDTIEAAVEITSDLDVSQEETNIPIVEFTEIAETPMDARERMAMDARMFWTDDNNQIASDQWWDNWTTRRQRPNSNSNINLFD